MSRIPLISMTMVAMFATANLQAQTPRPQVFIEVLLTAFVEAQRTFDVRQLDDVLAPDYVEISPAGEVDPRDKVL